MKKTTTHVSFLDKINLSKKVCNHIVGSNHTSGHRVAAGITIMIIGVGIVKLSTQIDFFIIHFVGDIVGYLIHGVGAIPVVKLIEGNE